MQNHQFTFTGNAKEYFGIWIVNLFLSIITLGIYTAWAKVRRMRYFYANTHLDGHNFEYHAKPMSILIGRFIVVGVLIAFQILVNFFPAATIILIPYLLILPWVINKALRFNARVTSYRNVRFSFKGSYGRAALVFLVMPMVAALSLDILAPFASRMSVNYIGDNTRYGTAKFITDANLRALYGNWGASLGFFILGTLIIVGLGIAIISLTGNMDLFMNAFNPSGNSPTSSMNILFATIPAFIYLIMTITYLFYKAGVRNIAYNGTTLEGGHQFQSTIGRRRYAWILLTNLLATIATIGLLRPWAAIRTWRYQVDNTSLESQSDLGKFIEQRQHEGAAVSSEFLDIEGIDFGL